jgi:hypothetical protein
MFHALCVQLKSGAIRWSQRSFEGLDVGENLRYKYEIRLHRASYQSSFLPWTLRREKRLKISQVKTLAYACGRLTVSFGSAIEIPGRLSLGLSSASSRFTVCQQLSLHWYCDSGLTAAAGFSVSTHRSFGNVFTSVTNDRWNLQRASRAGSWKILHARAKEYSVFMLSLSSSYEAKILVNISAIWRQGCMIVLSMN